MDDRDWELSSGEDDSELSSELSADESPPTEVSMAGALTSGCGLSDLARSLLENLYERIDRNIPGFLAAPSVVGSPPDVAAMVSRSNKLDVLVAAGDCCGGASLSSRIGIDLMGIEAGPTAVATGESVRMISRRRPGAGLHGAVDGKSRRS